MTIPLTDSNVDVVEFHKSNSPLNIEVTLNFTTPDYTQIAPPCIDVPTLDDCTTILRKTDLFFIGYKNATDAIQPYRLQQNKIDISGTLQNNSTFESFVCNQMKPQTEKSNKHGSYTDWKDVQKADESICGVYLTYEELDVLTANSRTLKIGFPLTV
jgi:hypothetical protein